MEVSKISNELNYARQLVGEAMVAPDHCLDVITIACAATYRVDDFFTAPRILALGKKGTGKSTLLKIAKYLAANTTAPTGVLAMTAPSYVADFRMNPKCTHLLDEVNHLFGEAGQNGKSSKFYTYINQGYSRETAFAQHQENKVPLQIPIFGFVFMAGLGLACPEDTRDRSVVIKMEKASGKVRVADFAREETRGAFTYAGRMLQSWAQRVGTVSTETVTGLHAELYGRRLEIWGPLLAMAQAAGGDWTERLLTAFERLELNAGIPVYAPEDQLLADWLVFCATYDCNDGVPSGQFAEFANGLEHGAYTAMNPAVFRRFATRVLGPTTPFYDHDEGKMVRGWGGSIMAMNTENAQARLTELETTAESDSASDNEIWEDF